MSPTIHIFEILEKSGKEKQVACFFGWDSDEMINGYSTEELMYLRKMIDDVIYKMQTEVPNQLTLFGE